MRCCLTRTTQRYETGHGQRERDRIAREIEEGEKTGQVGARTRKSRGSIAPAITSISEIGAEHAFKAKSAYLSAPRVFALLTLVCVCLFWGPTVKKVNNMHLQNVVMQLRKVCSHPFLFDWHLDPRTQQPVVERGSSTRVGR